MAVVAGVVWTLQGLNILRGSAMSGQTTVVVVGPVVAIVGLALVVVGMRCAMPRA